MRFGFRSLIVAPVLFSVAIWAACWFTADWRERQRVVADLRSLGASFVAFENVDGSITISGETENGWKWMRTENFWTYSPASWLEKGEVRSVGFVGPIATDGIGRHPTITSVYLSTGTVGVDDSLVRLHALPNLDYLDLAKSDVTDAGIERMIGLDSLKTLCLRDTAVTDDCIDELAALPSLRMVGLEGTQVSDAGVARLRKMRPGLGVWGR